MTNLSAWHLFADSVVAEASCAKTWVRTPLFVEIARIILHYLDLNGPLRRYTGRYVEWGACKWQLGLYEP